AQNVATAQKQSILAKVATRFGMDPNGFANTLRATVFKGASNEEFAALLVVADSYGLNPLTKELYAFPQKGGGIVPLVSIDGWIRIMNDHPQFDGIEFTDIPDDAGKLIAIETVIYRKDRSRPIRVTEYLDECKRNTDPWNKSPARMLRHRSLIQCARIAFGFSGIYAEDDVEVGTMTLGGDLTPAPMRQANVRQIGHDADTGEITEEGRGDEQRGEQHLDGQGREVNPQEAVALDIIERAGKVELLVDYTALAEEAQPHIDAMSDEEMAGECNKALRAARQRVTK
ncbi:recombinase RecT, partial [Sphingomonas sp.]|uniref:recombinase RecT n=1 Tax=Sphingomonas sp. TaxID=28214 RepID=UPI0035A95AFB